MVILFEHFGDLSVDCRDNQFGEKCQLTESGGGMYAHTTPKTSKNAVIHRLERWPSSEGQQVRALKPYVPLKCRNQS